MKAGKSMRHVFMYGHGKARHAFVWSYCGIFLGSITMIISRFVPWEIFPGFYEVEGPGIVRYIPPTDPVHYGNPRYIGFPIVFILLTMLTFFWPQRLFLRISLIVVALIAWLVSMNEYRAATAPQLLGMGMPSMGQGSHVMLIGAVLVLVASFVYVLLLAKFCSPVSTS
jgi:hypothetical protein